jgi:hypothetical protein
MAARAESSGPLFVLGPPSSHPTVSVMKWYVHADYPFVKMSDVAKLRKTKAQAPVVEDLSQDAVLKAEIRGCRIALVSRGCWAWAPGCLIHLSMHNADPASDQASGWYIYYSRPWWCQKILWARTF